MTTSYTAQDMAVMLDDMRESITALDASHAGVHAALGHVRAELQGISHMLSKEYMLEDVARVETISPTVLRLDRQGRRFLSIFAPVAIVGVAADLVGVRGYTFTLNPGWNLLGFPDGTLLTGPTGSSQAVIVKATNFIANANAPIIGASNVPLVSTAPANTSAAADTPLAFVSSVNHWTLQNNSGQVIYYEMDAPASTSSLALAQNGQVFFDWPITTLHVYTATAVAVNGATGLVVKGRA